MLMLKALLKKLGKIDKMRGLPSILSFFRNEFDKFDNTVLSTNISIYLSHDHDDIKRT